MQEVQSATATGAFTHQKILCVGRGGSGKSAQIFTLPGRKFAYIFDPAAMGTLGGCPNLDVVQFLPEAVELDASLKGFNKGTKDDKPASAKEPSLYLRWVRDLNERAEAKFFDQYDWLCFDSLTLLSNAVMDRQLFINNRYGGIEDLADFRVVGSKFAEVFRSILSMPMNIYCTGHIDSFQDDKTKRIEYQLRLPGKARSMLPLMFSNIWKAEVAEDEKTHKTSFMMRLRPEPRGFADIRCSLRGLQEVEPVNIERWDQPENYGIGSLLRRSGFKLKARTAS